MPLYESVKEAIRRAIERRVFQPGDQLPSTKELAKRMRVALVTVHRALQELADAGILRRGQGHGTFVHEDYAKRSRKAHGIRIGLVLDEEKSLSDCGLSRVLEGIRRQASELGCELLVLPSGEDPRAECQGYVLACPSAELVGRPIRPGRLASVPHAGLAVVAVGSTVRGEGVRRVGVDPTEVCRVAMSMLGDLGHRAVCYVGRADEAAHGPPLYADFRDEASRCGIELSFCDLPRPTDGMIDPAVREMLKKHLGSARADGPTAVFASSVEAAGLVYEVASEWGLAIPEDLSVIAAEDSPLAACLSPALTTMRIPEERIGRAAVLEIAEIVAQGSGQTRHGPFTVSVALRRSVAPPRTHGQPARAPTTAVG